MKLEKNLVLNITQSPNILNIMKKIDTLLKNVLRVFLLTSLVGCSKTIEIVPEFEYAKYAAVVQCYDEFGLRVNNSGVKVSVDSLEYLSTQTNETGYFELKVPVGTYTFNYTKDGFADHSHKMVTLIGGYQPVLYYDACLFKPVDVSVSEHQLIYYPEDYKVWSEGFAISTTPFMLVLGFKKDLNSDIIRIATVIDCESVYKDGVTFSGGFRNFIKANLHGADSVYTALYSKNSFGGGYSTLKQLSEFQKKKLLNQII